jgi:hypothetical protein
MIQRARESTVDHATLTQMIRDLTINYSHQHPIANLPSSTESKYSIAPTPIPAHQLQTLLQSVSIELTDEELYCAIAVCEQETTASKPAEPTSNALEVPSPEAGRARSNSTGSNRERSVSVNEGVELMIDAMEFVLIFLPPRAMNPRTEAVLRLRSQLSKFVIK